MGERIRECLLCPRKPTFCSAVKASTLPQHAELPLDFAVARPSAKIIEMSASRRRH
jgi:hypothetical protein